MKDTEHTILIPDVLTTRQMAQPSPIGFDIPESTQAKMRMDGRIPYYKLSKKYIRYRRSEIEDWIWEHAVVKSNTDERARKETES